MDRCPNCGAPLIGTRHCTNCGAPVPLPSDLQDAETADVLGAPPDAEPTVALGPPPPDDPDARGSRFPLPALLALLVLLIAGGGLLLFALRDDPAETAGPVDLTVTQAPATTPPPVVVTPEPTELATPTATPLPSDATTASPGATTTSDPTATLDPTASPGLTTPVPTSPGTSSGTTTPFPTGGTTSAPTTGATLPATTPFYVVIVASKNEAEGGRAAAEATLTQVRSAGQPALLFQSSQYGSLRSGYWVAAAGPFSDRASAIAAVPQVRAASPSFAEAYARCVGTAAECAS